MPGFLPGIHAFFLTTPNQPSFTAEIIGIAGSVG
jgi:hypothetical protein